MAETTSGRWSPSDVRDRIGANSWIDQEFAGSTFAIVPTSVSVTGSFATSSLGDYGRLQFDNAEIISVNGCFSSTYQDYFVRLSLTSTLDGQDLDLRLRSVGTDLSSTTYHSQRLEAYSTTVAAYRDSSRSAFMAGFSGTNISSSTIHFFGPYKTQPTEIRVVSAGGFDGGYIREYAGINTSTDLYDGFSFIHSGTNRISGYLTVYGLVG